MNQGQSGRKRIAIAWAILACVVVLPIAVAANSPLLAFRDPIYVLAGFAGIVAMVFLLFQPLLAMGYMPGLMMRSARRIHRWVGAGLVAAIILHVAGLWITSPPDVVDALMFRSPTPFSAWGVVAMWAVFATAVVAASRKKLRLRQPTWRKVHMTLAVMIAVCSVVHAVLIDGTMGTITKVGLCVLVLVAVGRVLFDLRSK